MVELRELHILSGRTLVRARAWALDLMLTLDLILAHVPACFEHWTVDWSTT